MTKGKSQHNKYKMQSLVRSQLQKKKDATSVRSFKLSLRYGFVKLTSGYFVLTAVT